MNTRHTEEYGQLGLMIDAYLTANKLTIQDLADKAEDCTAGYLRYILTGKRVLSIRYATRIAQATGLNLHSLLIAQLNDNLIKEGLDPISVRKGTQ